MILLNNVMYDAKLHVLILNSSTIVMNTESVFGTCYCNGNGMERKEKNKKKRKENMKRKRNELFDMR